MPLSFYPETVFESITIMQMRRSREIIICCYCCYCVWWWRFGTCGNDTADALQMLQAPLFPEGVHWRTRIVPTSTVMVHLKQLQEVLTSTCKNKKSANNVGIKTVLKNIPFTVFMFASWCVLQRFSLNIWRCIIALEMNYILCKCVKWNGY